MSRKTVIEYKSKNGYLGKLYGVSSFSIYAPDGHEVFHTGSRNINTFDELKEQVNEFPQFLEILKEN